MKKYFQVMFDSGLEGHEHVNTYELGQFDYLSLLKGNSIPQSDVEDVKLFVNDSKLEPVDYLSNPLSWSILSERFLDLVLELISNEVELLHPQLLSASTGEKNLGYTLVNALRKVDCLDKKNTKFLEGPNGESIACDIVIDSQKVPDDTHIFHIDGTFGAIAVSNMFLKNISGQGLKGIAVLDLTERVDA